MLPSGVCYGVKWDRNEAGEEEEKEELTDMDKFGLGVGVSDRIE
jgi:hypothetical protein